jgi:hypothetical protein
VTDREFRDNALIAVSASLASYAMQKNDVGVTLHSCDEIASKAANIVSALIEQRKAMEAKR